MAFVRDTDRGIEVYLSRRPLHFRYYPGAFVFPGGRLDRADADLKATACREVKEEVGVDIDPRNLVLLRDIHTSPHAGPVYHMLTFAYRADSAFTTLINPDEIEEEIWMTASEALSTLDLPYQIRAAVYTISMHSTVEQLLQALAGGSVNEDYWF